MRARMNESALKKTWDGRHWLGGNSASQTTKYLRARAERARVDTRAPLNGGGAIDRAPGARTQMVRRGRAHGERAQNERV